MNFNSKKPVVKDNILNQINNSTNTGDFGLENNDSLKVSDL